jgi:UDP-N-acetylmuramoyl-L-alanyl-D-glutamate--2,6-diaminopimelate ligase
MYGMDLPTIVRGLEAVQSIPRRLERIDCGQPFGVFIDYAHTPDTLAMSLKAIKQSTQGRVIVVFAVGADRDSLRPQIGRVLERNSDIAVLTSDDPSRNEPLRDFHDVLDGCQHTGRPHLIPSREKAITWALSEAQEGDVVLIAGKGHSVQETFDGESYTYDDRDITRGWLYDTAWNDAPVL